MKVQPTKLKLDAPLVLLAISLLLAPIIGGQVSLDSQANLSGLIDALVGGPELPLLSHVLLTIPIAAAFILLLRRQVVQVPNAVLTTTLFLFFGFVLGTVLVSSFRMTSLATGAEWMAYALAFVTTVGAVGRRVGPVVVFTALFAGCVLTAMRGLREYGEIKSVDPSWRIFAGWVNPNAVAAMLLVGFLLGLALLALSKDRLASLLCGVGVAIVGLGIALTQSKGALLTLGVGVLVYAMLLLIIGKGEVIKRAVVRGGSALAAVALLVVLVQLRAAPAPTPGGGPAAPAALGRFAQAESTSEQSAGFRTLLWKGALQMTTKHPMGYGIGTYRFESGRSGLHTQTVFTHSAFLQLATEGSWALPILLWVAGGIWIWLAFRGWTTLPPERRVLQAGVFAAVTALVAHSWIDSDLYYFGIGLAFFTLLGVGLLLSADAVAPEFAPKPVRWVGMAGGVLIVLLLLYVGVAESMRARARAQIMMRDAQGAAATLASVRGFAPNDGEAWYLTGQIAPTDSERLAAIERAAELSPSTRNLRLLARQYVVAGENSKAVFNYRAALIRDPNNLLALLQLGDLYAQMGNPNEATKIWERLVAVEDTSYFKIRSLPDLVPTETYVARIRLGKSLTGHPKISMLQPAIDGFKSYLAKTVPLVKQMAASDPPADYAGEDATKAQEKLAVAAQAASDLATAYRGLGDAKAAEAADEAGGAFSSAFVK